MKKFGVLLVLILCCGMVYAQQTSLKICGISMSQSASAFKAQLEAKGFNLMQGRTDDKGYRGIFAGYQCSLFVNPYEENISDYVHSVEIGLSTNSGISTHERFRELEIIYRAKYGECKRNVWYDSNNSLYEKEELIWSFSYGYIMISYEKKGFDGSLSVFYCDYTNVKKNASKSGLNDI